MNKITKKLAKMYRNHKNDTQQKQLGLSVLSMQVFFCLDEKTLYEEIENIIGICCSGTAYQINIVCKLCAVSYHEDDQIVEFDIAFAAPEYKDCIKACSDLLSCGSFPYAAECTFTPNKRNEKLVAQIWHKLHQEKLS